MGMALGMPASNTTDHMRGSLLLNDIEFDCILGLNPEERVRPQKVRLDVEIEVDFLRSEAQESTKDTVDWSSLPRALSQHMQESRFFLAESACLALARKVLGHSNALWTRVKLTKLEANTGATSVAAMLEARQGEL